MPINYDMETEGPPPKIIAEEPIRVFEFKEGSGRMVNVASFSEIPGGVVNVVRGQRLNADIVSFLYGSGLRAIEIPFREYGRVKEWECIKGSKPKQPKRLKEPFPIDVLDDKLRIRTNKRFLCLDLGAFVLEYTPETQELRDMT